MKSVKLVLPILAFVIAFSTAIASINSSVVTAYYSGTLCEVNSTENGCSVDNGGIVCKLTIEPYAGLDAYAINCTQRLKKPSTP